MRRSRGFLLLLPLALALLAPATSASADVETFVRFEEIATANWLVTEQCQDGSTARTAVTAVAGREFESPDLDDVNTFATVLIRTRQCDGAQHILRASGPVAYSSSPSLMEAHVTGTVPVLGSGGGEVTIDVTWEGVGGLDTDVNQTRFDGFVGIFTSKTRDAVATGTVVLDGETLVSGPALSAEIETLEDRNRFLP
ncbi:MAG TPA: hypothetical protein VHG90_12960 [Acidimicrobiales bacterium]|nr:hypothetical protein [Acidimicrobiales bacterium]